MKKSAVTPNPQTKENPAKTPFSSRVEEAMKVYRDLLLVNEYEYAVKDSYIAKLEHTLCQLTGSFTEEEKGIYRSYVNGKLFFQTVASR